MIRDEAQPPRDASYFTGHLRTLALELRAGVLDGIRAATVEELSSAVGDRGGDTIYRLDEHGESVLLDYCARWGAELPFMLVAEGLEEGQRIFPEGADPNELAFTLIVDPIDGTRGLMYGKRSAWALFGVAPAPRDGAYPTLAGIGVALQAELPTVRAALADVVWAARGEGVQGETHDLRTGEIVPFQPRPSRANTLVGGFSTISKFFPGAKVAAAELEEKLFLELLGPPPTESPQVFDDEYICSGGQLYELMVGHDRFLADLRPLLHTQIHDASHVIRIACHPYDLCTELIAREAGVIVTDPRGQPLAAPLDTHSPVAWVGYANETLHRQIEPVLQRLLREMGAMP
ncbi:MAG TPA: inositol monophosphatase [Ktedonobacterales bacterium]